MTHYVVKISTVYEQAKTFSHFKRTFEAADAECALKQAKNDLEAVRKIFSEWHWKLEYVEEVEAKP